MRIGDVASNICQALGFGIGRHLGVHLERGGGADCGELQLAGGGRARQKMLKTEREKRFRVYREAPGFHPGPCAQNINGFCFCFFY